MAKKKDTVTLSKVAVWQGISAILGVLLLISIFTGGFGGAETDTIQKREKPAAAPSDDAPSGEVDMAALIDDDAIKGNPDAPVIIVEWSDFECPFCSRFYSQTLSQIEEEYIDTGKVKLIYRDFPLNSIHPNAQKAAEAAECAGEQGSYFEMHDKLFEDGVAGGSSTYKGYAEELGLNTDEFNACLDSGAMTDEVAQDLRDGQAAGVTGTPGFMIDGELVKGAQPFSAFKQIIDRKLTG